MAKDMKAYWLHCLSPMHVGTGRGIGYIDLPLYREATTNWPAVPGSGVKGVWADHYHRATGATLRTRNDNLLLKAAFGTAGDETSNAGALIATDARLVCLPVRSFKGTFVWATSPLALKFLHRDLVLAGFGGVPAVPPTEADALVATLNAIALDKVVYLEDLDLPEKDSPQARLWANTLAGWVFQGDETWQKEFAKRFAIVPDLVFDHLAETGTEVATRVRIDDELKTVVDGQLWTEEALPAESILAGLVQCQRANGVKGVTAQQLADEFATRELRLQIGGKASVGRGQARCIFTSPEGK